MTPVVAVIAAGAMGSAVGRRLVENGVTVLTSLAGRSAATEQRARAAGMTPVADEALAAADILLSILPPAEAEGLAERLSALFATAPAKPLFVDCNAICPDTVLRIGAVVAASGTPFLDAGIIGPPPTAGGKGPSFYVSGPDAARLLSLAPFGLEIRPMDGPLGAASALKMSYAGITKGLTALAAAMMLAATRAGAADALRQELAASQPQLLAWFTRQLPSMYPKAYRWVAEMEEIAAFVGADPAARTMFEGAAALYERLAEDFRAEQRETGALSGFLGQ